jgi:serine/threonine protein kinase
LEDETLLNGAKSAERNEGVKLVCGTPNYMSPELIARKKASNEGLILMAADMWALGVCLTAMMTGSLPFRGSTEKELFGKI